MIIEWIKFGIVAALILCALISIAVSVLGTYRFKFALNRMQSAAITDAAGILFMMTALIFVYGVSFSSIRLIFIIMFMWISSPVSSHLITKLEYMTAEDITKHAAFEELPKIQRPAAEER